MADQKITQLTSLAGADAATNDVIPVVDVSATTTKKMTRAEFFKNTPSVGIGTSNPSGGLQISNTFPTITLDETNTDAAYQQTQFGMEDGSFRIQTRTSTNTFVSNDYLIDKGSSGAILHAWRISNVERMRINSNGDVGIGTTSPAERLSVTGNVTISGSLSKGSGSFKIDHPLKPDTHHLVHSFIEGPQADNLYRGKATLVGGVATVNLDEAGRMTEGTFVALNGNVQCFTTNESGWAAVRGTVVGNLLTIKAQDSTCTDEVSWLVIGERHDQHMLDTSWTDENGRIITEPEKIAEAL